VDDALKSITLIDSSIGYAAIKEKSLALSQTLLFYLASAAIFYSAVRYNRQKNLKFDIDNHYQLDYNELCKYGRCRYAVNNAVNR
jgi:hypothetical protein